MADNIILPTVTVTGTAGEADTPAQIQAKERSLSDEEVLRTALDDFKAGIWTALPCVVETYNPAANTVRARPGMAGVYTDWRGQQSAVHMPLLVDVPVVFQSGGGACFTTPVHAGDECLVVFSARDIDSWFQYGGHGNIPMSMRKLDLSDGFAFVGPMSKPHVIGSISTTEAQIRNVGGNAFIALNPSTGAVRIHAPGGFEIVGDVTHTGSQTTSGTVTGSTDVVGHGTSLHSHIHTGVQAGSGVTGMPA